MREVGVETEKPHTVRIMQSAYLLIGGYPNFRQDKRLLGGLRWKEKANNNTKHRLPESVGTFYWLR